ncbi:hypothetical protein HGH93_28880 [Chitinophaga polysaccharea]|uniref:hypothetical protein n=1 Tax=Chitinophaga TaxID=79328 RepID=UPI0014554DFD|nr:MULTISPECIES: hypothetical protein [Chitinophaga]NLR62141.1 hypothetical protein [Chitinophaga polysaccharea]NLU95595.1 hypothetical protein [Chitinophaga sp. Ak27]
MAKRFQQGWLFIKNIYLNAEKAVIGHVILHTPNTYEQAKIKLIFDYAFFYAVLLMSLLFINMLSMNRVNMILIPVMIGILIGCLMLLRKGVAAKKVGLLTSMTTLIIPIISSFLNNQDLSPKYTLIWIMSILLCYITANLAATLLWSLILCTYLVTIAYVKLNNIAVYVSPGYSPVFQYLANPLIVGMYLLFLIRALGQYYRNIISLEQKRTAEKQQQHLSLINQHLTKQFLLVKGFSRSGKSAFLKGETEFLEACFTEIEKQCGTAIDFLNEPGEM